MEGGEAGVSTKERSTKDDANVAESVAFIGKNKLMFEKISPRSL